MLKVVIKYLFVIICCVAYANASAQSVGGTTSGSGLFCAGTGNGFISLTGFNGTSIVWQKSTDTVTWTPTGTSNFPSQSYFNLNHTTCYRAVVQDGSNPPDTSTVSCIDVFPPSIGGHIVGADTFCISPGTGNGTLTLVNDTGSVLYWQYSVNGGASWTNEPDTTTVLNYTNFTDNRIYRAVVQSGNSCPVDTSDWTYFAFDSVTIVGSISGSDTVCYINNSGTLTLSGKQGNVTSWLWKTDSTGFSTLTNTDTTQTYSGLITSTYYAAIVKNGACPADTTGLAAIKIIPNPVDAGPDSTIELGQSIVLQASGNGTFVWSPASGLDSINALHPTATPGSTTTYTITATDINSCISTDSVTLTTYTLKFNGMVSNLMTPNGDGINDTWYIQSILDYPDNEVFIYNIYGNMVFTKKGYTNDWKGTYNGKDLPDGTYYFVLKVGTDKPIKGALDILKNK